MSARSPSSVSGLPDDVAVAQDFADSLKDLQMNNRYEISNLTIIAKENTEHAQAISKALEQHIQTTSPNRKLPALYVLDSIVKNVGTPYTVYLGRGLYSTFMQAYTLVDGGTRRQMESMLKTWKEPVPGSMETRPVFPPDVVRPIENALIKARTAALQHQKQPVTQFGPRQTQTPPQMNGQYAPPPGHYQGQPHQYGRSPSQQPPPTQPPYNYSSTPQPSGHPSTTPYSQPGINADDLKRDVASIISASQAKFAVDWSNMSLQTQLKALLALQSHLNTHQLDQPTLGAIKAQVDNMKSTLAPPTPQLQAPTPQWPPATSTPQPYQQPPPQQAYQYAQPTPKIPQIPQAALNGLSALFANGQKPSTPQMRQSVPSLQGATHAQLNTVQQSAPPAAVGADLMAALSKAGLVGRNTQSPAPPHSQQLAPPPVQQPPPNPAALLAGLQHLLPSSSNTPTASIFPPNLPMPPLKPSAAALKTFNPSLVHALYDAQPNQCSTCGRRFLSTETGREAKTRHLDWHFRTNQRIAEAQRGHRNWFVDEMEWIKNVDYDASTAVPGAEGTANAAAAAAKKTKGPADQYVRAPPGMTRNTCSICYEEMGSSHPEELQDWVFMNAAVYKGKIVHATCLAEMKGAAARDAGKLGRERSATPESTLGKRKAEGSLGLGFGAVGRVKME